MTHETAHPVESGPTSTRRKHTLTALRLMAMAVPNAVVVIGVAAEPGWISLLPSVVLRGTTEAVLRGVLIAYSTLVLMAFVGLPLSAWLLVRARHMRRHRPRIERALLIGVSSLLSLAMLELGAAAWRGWMHRFPRLPTAFQESAPDEYRIVVLGGSSALGEPYRPWLSVGQIVAWQLQRAMPDRRVECEILACLGDSLEKQHHKLAALKRRPHAMIIYSGHNEFAARFEEERDPWVVEEPRYWPLQRAYRATLVSPFCRLAYELVSKNRLDRPPPLTGRHQLIDPPLCSPSETADILADFSGRLETIVAYCDQIGALPILIIPPANEAGYEPSRSTLPPTVSHEDRRRLVGDFQDARTSESSDPSRGAAGYEAILARHPDFAEAHVRLARLLERRGDLAEAGRHYLAALDADGLPIRCPAPFRDAYVQVARRHPRSILIDGRRELAEISPDGLIGDHVIQDTHHPTLRGHVALAGAVLRELRSKNALSRPLSIDLPLDPVSCADHFGITASNWATVCKRTSVHYKRVAGYRYDPAERRDLSSRYAEAEGRIRAGTVPVDLGIPGVGTDREAMIPPGGLNR